MLLNLVTGIFLARGLGPEGRGAYLAIAFWPLVLGWCATLGFPKASAYFRAKSPNHARALFANALVVVLVLGSLLVWVGMHGLPRILDHYPADVVWIGQWLLLSLLAIALSDVCQALLQGAGRFGLMTCTRLLMPAVQCVGLGILFMTGRLHVGTAVLVMVTGTLTVLLVQILAIGMAGEIGRPDRALLVETGRYAVRSYPAFLAAIALSYLDQIFLIPLLAPADLGLYIVATRAFLLAQLPAAAAQVLFAEIPTLPKRQGRALAGRTLATAAVLMGLAGLCLGFFAPTLVHILFGTAFLPSVPAFRILLPGAVAAGLAGIANESLGGLGKPLLTSVTRVVTLLVMAVGLRVVAPTWGIVGASWVVTLAHCFGFVLSGAFLWREPAT